MGAFACRARRFFLSLGKLGQLRRATAFCKKTAIAYRADALLGEKEHASKRNHRRRPALHQDHAG